MSDPGAGMAEAWRYAAALAIGYGIGAIPFGKIVTRLAGLGDIRAIGSGNIGATNVLRTGRKDLAALTLVLDAGKGASAVLIAALLGPKAALLGGLGAVLGHLFPIGLGFKGGKGVATAFGVMVAIAWPVAIIAASVWFLTAFFFRYSSLAALAACAAAPLAAWRLTDPHTTLMAAVLALLVMARHRANIERLIAGTEPRIGGKASPSGNGD